MKKEGYYWHLHHTIPLEWTWDLEERIRFIKTSKPCWERPRRLALLKPVMNLPKAVLDMNPSSGGPNLFFNENWEAVKELHAKQCGCPFYDQDFNIFSYSEYDTRKAPRLPRGMKSPKTPRKAPRPGKGQKRKP